MPPPSDGNPLGWGTAMLAGRRVAGLPRMAWVCSIGGGGGGRVAAEAGEDVELREDGLFEGAWAGAFPAFAPEEAATVFGSGVRLAAGGGVLLIPPSHTCEAIYHALAGDTLLCSNSLPLLLGRLGDEPAFDPRLGARFATLVFGIDRAARAVLRTRGGLTVERLLHRNALARGGWVTPVPKPLPGEAPASFAAYRALLLAELGAVAANAADRGRRAGYGLLATLSSGYDSPACAALARELGCREALTLATSRGGEGDSGAPVGAALGMRVREYPHPLDCRAMAGRELEFLAGGMSGEDVAYAGFEERLPGALLVTGFHGDRVWSRTPRRSREIERGDTSGASLQEFRLRVGFVHAIVPMIGARYEPEVKALSEAPEMAPWRVGGRYDRPVPRRIAEEAGVPRAAFGRRKLAASVLLHHGLGRLSPEARAAVAAVEAGGPAARLPWLERRHRLLLRTSRLLGRLQRRTLAGRLVGRLPAAARVLEKCDYRIAEHADPHRWAALVAALRWRARQGPHGR